MGREGWDGVRVPNPTSWTTWTAYSVSESGLSLLESGGREGIRTLGLLVANEENKFIRRGVATTCVRRGCTQPEYLEYRWRPWSTNCSQRLTFSSSRTV